MINFAPLPFSAAIFDLDGTLLDSMYVWQRIDEIFFAKRGMCVPEDYGHALAGLSYRESAEYTIRRFGFSQPWQEIVKEWTDLAVEEYSHHVRPKPGAARYLRALRRAGVKLAVATALPEYLYRPCLENCGLLNLFDALCSTDDTGGRGKRDGEVFLLAAQRIGADPGDCVVFEDVLDGIRGAKKAGMMACCVRDPAGRKAHAEIEKIADRMIDCFDELERPEIPGRCVIFTARCDGDPAAACACIQPDDYILCADAGYRLAARAGITPHTVIGDFDSAEMPADVHTLRFPVVKDDTDTLLCVRHAFDRGYDDFYLVGGLGGRLDHTLANLQTLAFIAARGGRACLCDGNVRVYAIKDASVSIPRTAGKISVFAMDGVCTGVSISGTKYTMENGRISPDFPIGMGNDFIDNLAEITVQSGTLLVVCELRRE